MASLVNICVIFAAVFLLIQQYCAIFHIFLVTRKNLKKIGLMRNSLCHMHKNWLIFLTSLSQAEKFVNAAGLFWQIAVFVV